MNGRWFLIYLVVLSCGVTRANDVGELTEVPISQGDREHWAFLPLAAPVIPITQNPSRSQSAIDDFIRQPLQQRGLDLAPEADRATLLRRVTFDLTGLPPTVDELTDFEQATSPTAYEGVIERLLQSPAYGERQAQHWLDLARFAETDGFEHDKIRPDAWRYRDWVIQALNDDLSYADFVVQQIAGDEQSPDLVIATMFGLAGPDMPDINDQAERRHNRLNELTGTVGSVFLGLQLGCAECHDHKYDPLSQADFYRLRAIFEPAVPILKRDVAYTSFSRSSNQSEQPARVWMRGDHRRPGPMVEAAWPRIAREEQANSAAFSSGLTRTQFARQLVDGSTPITARVIVNRLWQQHFPQGLCATSSDFGVINAGPTHPELLDWLAQDLIAHDWSLKHLHRQLVLSATYRQSSRSADDTRVDDGADWARRLQLDPDGRWLSRQSRRRLSGEELRDAALSMADVLHDIKGGPGVRPPLPHELVRSLLKGQWVTSENPADHTRRSIYLFARRNLRYPLFEAFDRPDANASCAVRGRSTTAPQALMLINGELWQQLAQDVAQRLITEHADPAARVRELYRLAFSRSPSGKEIPQCVQFVTQQRAALAAEHQGATTNLELAAWTDACVAIMNSSEFLYCD